MQRHLRTALVGFDPSTPVASTLEHLCRVSSQELYIIRNVEETPCIFGVAHQIIGCITEFVKLPPDTLAEWVRRGPASWTLVDDQDLDAGLRLFLSRLGILLVRPEVPVIASTRANC